MGNDPRLFPQLFILHVDGTNNTKGNEYEYVMIS